jgi:hypothetical protein
LSPFLGVPQNYIPPEKKEGYGTGVMEGPLKRVVAGASAGANSRRESCTATLDTTARLFIIRSKHSNDAADEDDDDEGVVEEVVRIELSEGTAVVRRDDAVQNDFSFSVGGVVLVAPSEESLHSWLEALDEVTAATATTMTPPLASPRNARRPPPPPPPHPASPAPKTAAAVTATAWKRKTARRSEVSSVILRQSRMVSAAAATGVGMLDDYLCGLTVDSADVVEPPQQQPEPVSGKRKSLSGSDISVSMVLTPPPPSQQGDAPQSHRAVSESYEPKLQIVEAPAVLQTPSPDYGDPSTREPQTAITGKKSVSEARILKPTGPPPQPPPPGAKPAIRPSVPERPKPGIAEPPKKPLAQTLPAVFRNS